MDYIIVGLGNPESDYANTRHNAGRMVLEYFRSEKGFPEWENRKELKARVSVGELEKEPVVLVEPDNYMNNSGESLEKLVRSEKEACLPDRQAERLIVVHDDIDLPIGALRISFDRGSGGHRGVESVVRSIKTRAFTRIRVGIAPVSPEGVIRKPEGKDAVVRYVLKKFTETEREKFDQVTKNAVSAIETIISDGRDKAMGDWN